MSSSVMIALILLAAPNAGDGSGPPPATWTQVGQYSLKSDVLVVTLDLQEEQGHGSASDPWPIYFYMDADDEDVYRDLSREQRPDPVNKRTIRIWRKRFTVNGCETAGHCAIELYRADTPDLSPESRSEIRIPIQYLPELPFRVWSADCSLRVGGILVPPSKKKQPLHYPYVVIRHE